MTIQNYIEENKKLVSIQFILIFVMFILTLVLKVELMSSLIILILLIVINLIQIKLTIVNSNRQIEKSLTLLKEEASDLSNVEMSNLSVSNVHIFDEISKIIDQEHKKNEELEVLIRGLHDNELNLEVEKKEYQEMVEGFIALVNDELIEIENNNFLMVEDKVRMVKIKDNLSRVMILGQIDRISKIVQPQEEEIKDLIDQVAIFVEDNNRNNSLTITNEVKPTKVKVDLAWFNLALNEVINNSLDYRRHQNAIIKFYSEENPGQYTLCISDNGAGIDEHILKNVFNKRNADLIGLKTEDFTQGNGLFIVKKICDSMNVKVKIESKPNQGTLVKFIFQV